MNIAAILPETILTLGAIILMMVAAFGGQRAATFTTWAAVAILIVASILTLGRPQDAGPLFGGLIVADGFGAFGKVLIFAAAAVACIAAHGWF
ncbi:MAG: NADH-quinone oxidoreductase subunit N, partial [Sphingomicrobium sp.]